MSFFKIATDSKLPLLPIEAHPKYFRLELYLAFVCLVVYVRAILEAEKGNVSFSASSRR